MAQNEVHQWDTGTVFQVTLSDASSAVDLSSANSMDLIFKKPDLTTLTKEASFVNSGTDGKIKYSTQSGDLSVTGVWTLQAHVTLPTGNWRSDIGQFEVYRNL